MREVSTTQVQFTLQVHGLLTLTIVMNCETEPLTFDFRGITLICQPCDRTVDLTTEIKNDIIISNYNNQIG